MMSQQKIEPLSSANFGCRQPATRLSRELSVGVSEHFLQSFRSEKKGEADKKEREARERCRTSRSK